MQSSENLSDSRLAARVADTLAVPRAQPADSFVLHAPLELVARYALLPHVRPARREEARGRVESIARRFDAFGPAVGEPHVMPFESTEAAARRLVAAIDRGELDDVDSAATWLGARATPGELRDLLADDVLPRLSAAAHAPILLYQLARVMPRAEVSGELLRGLARELGRYPSWRVHWIEDRSPGEQLAGTADELFAAIAATPIAAERPEATPFIYPTIAAVDDGGVAAQVLGGVTARAPTKERGRAVLRAAAWSMLLEPGTHAAYGWTHCLTLPQAVLGIAGSASDPSRALAIAATHVVGFRAALAANPLVPAAPDGDPGLPLPAALEASPADAAAVVWHAADERVAPIVTELATRASVHEDAHFVKYTLACLDAAAADPEHRRLFLAAAASLAAWWARVPAPA